MRHFSSRVGVQRLGPNQCRLEMSLLMQPSIYIPFGVRHMVGGQVRTRRRQQQQQQQQGCGVGGPGLNSPPPFSAGASACLTVLTTAGILPSWHAGQGLLMLLLWLM